MEERERVRLRAGERITVKRDGVEESGVVLSVDETHYTLQTDDGRVLKYEFRYRQKRTKFAAGTRCSRCGRVLTTDEELDLTFLQSGEQGPPLCTDCRAAS
jgi:hypothetical protein